jgi:hypothetical protein
MVMKYNNIFHSKALQILSKLGFLVCKQAIWQPWTTAPGQMFLFEIKLHCYFLPENLGGEKNQILGIL